MMRLDRRFDHRVPTEMYLNAYVNDRPHRGFTVNVSETGIFLNTLPEVAEPRVSRLGLEFKLPGIDETIWAGGEMCYDNVDDYFHGRGIRFTAMASLHARLVREYCYRARRRKLLGTPLLRA